MCACVRVQAVLTSAGWCHECWVVGAAKVHRFPSCRVSLLSSKVNMLEKGICSNLVKKKKNVRKESLNDLH